MKACLQGSPGLFEGCPWSLDSWNATLAFVRETPHLQKGAARLSGKISAAPPGQSLVTEPSWSRTKASGAERTSTEHGR